MPLAIEVSSYTISYTLVISTWPSLEISDLVALINALTDRRVARDAVPFDHPQFCLPNGHNPDGSTIFVDLPAVGAEGHTSNILTFEQMLNGATGEHDMSISCNMLPLPNVN